MKLIYIGFKLAVLCESLPDNINKTVGEASDNLGGSDDLGGAVVSCSG